MNKKHTAIVGICVLLIGAGLTYTSIRIARLESRLEAIHRLLQQSTNQQVRYAFDPSFLDYFGERGAQEVLRAVRLQKYGPIAEPVQVLE